MIMDSSINTAWLLIFGLFAAFLPVIFVLITPFVKISIVLNLLKSALGLQNAPGILVETSLALTITIFSITPLLSDLKVKIYSFEDISFKKPPKLNEIKKLRSAFVPVKSYVEPRVGIKEQLLLKNTDPSTDLYFLKLCLAFLVTQLREGFTIGFSILLPFLAVDLIVANLLGGLGLMMMSPQTISLPIKLLLFIYVDGWLQITQGLIGWR